jgi:hypothetical protein
MLSKKGLEVRPAPGAGAPARRTTRHRALTHTAAPQIVKWSFYLSIPVFFGYGLARSEGFLTFLTTHVRPRGPSGWAHRPRARALLPRPERPASDPRPLLPPPPQFPGPALKPQGEHGHKLATLEDEYRRLLLEEAVDKVLADVKREKEAKKK